MTTTRKTKPASVLPALTYRSSKADEIAFLESVRALIPEGTYLADLFTQKFMNWTTGKILNDTAPDLMAFVEWEDTQRQNAEAQIVRDTREASEIITKQERRIGELEVAAQAAGRELSETRERLADEQAETHRIEQLKYDLECVAYKQTETIKARELEIQALKAKLYDLITTTGAA